VRLTDIWDRTRLALGDAAAAAGDLVEPTLRLGVTGLAGAGKTVFITALVRNLVAGGRMPLFDPIAEGRLRNAYLRPQPDDQVPRFDYERHLASLLEEPREWPESTKTISQLRISLEFAPENFWGRRLRRGRLNVDIVDYPGEWLLDLPLLGWSYADWSARTIAASRAGPRAKLAADWHKLLESLDPKGPLDEAAASRAAGAFRAYLSACRAARFSLSALPPGRFLMPGELAGSPALTFAPLQPPADRSAPRGSLWAMMARRYESYKQAVVKPFFRDHFARLDRQIVLVDALAALNAGPAALADLETALTDILACFRPGAGSWLTSILSRRIDRILFAATKADHLHREGHRRLEAILRRLAQHAIQRAEFAGAEVEVAAIAAIRATREATAARGGEDLPCIVGTPMAGERIAGRTFDGKQETAIFPGQLPEDPDAALAHGRDAPEPDEAEWRFIRFRPPAPAAGAGGEPVFPHIRLDRALNFLIGDKLG
jgi:hypothetical protein